MDEMKAAEARGDERRDRSTTRSLKLKKEQFNLRFQRATGQLENTARVRQVRRDIAGIKTIARRSAPQGSEVRRRRCRSGRFRAWW